MKCENIVPFELGGAFYGGTKKYEMEVCGNEMTSIPWWVYSEDDKMWFGWLCKSCGYMRAVAEKKEKELF